MASTTVEYPRLRPLESQWVTHEGQPVLVLRDRLGLSPGIAVPSIVALILSLCDGSRNLQGLRATLELRTGARLDPFQLKGLIEQLDEALVLDSPRFAAALAMAQAEFRQLPHRPPALAGHVYPADPGELARTLEGYADDGRPTTDDGRPTTAKVSDRSSVAIREPAHEGRTTSHELRSSVVGRRSSVVRGLVSPHIDYQRGGRVYARTWARAHEALAAADLVVIFGTDHCGGPGRVTLTRQHYATPWGVLPTCREVVDAVAETIGAEAAFAEEYHHANEHSIELAAVWLHYLRGGQACELVPVLCGSFEPFTSGRQHIAEEPRLGQAVEALRAATAGRRVIAIAAADLAHVGPAFGDGQPFGPSERSDLAEADRQLLGAICRADAEAFLKTLCANRDRHRICGLPPIYLLLRYLGEATGVVVDYDQCPSDAAGGSLVSIGGVVLA